MFVYMFMCLWLGIGQKKLLSAFQYHSPLLLDRRSLFDIKILIFLSDSGSQIALMILLLLPISELL